MKKIFGIGLLTIFWLSNLLAMKVSINHYLTYDKSPISNIFLVIDGNTLDFLPSDSLNLYQARALVTIMYKKDTTIYTFDKYVLTSELSKEPINFSDTKRFRLDKGEYSLEIKVEDLNDSSNFFEFKKKISAQFENESVLFSDIHLYGKKDGVEDGMINQPYHYFGTHDQTLIYYLEAYKNQMFQEEPYYIQLSIYPGYKDEKNEERELIKTFKRMKGVTNEKVLGNLDISELPSGNYHLKVSAYSNKKEYLNSISTNFIRKNLRMEASDFIDLTKDIDSTFVAKIPIDKLDYTLRAHVPIINNNVVSVLDFIINDTLVESKRAFIFQYWNEVYKEKAEYNFDKYMEVVDVVDKEYYDTVGRGFQTDRGYIFLKYGKPNEIIAVEDDPAAPPYEIWFYHELLATGQSNVRFIFYNPSLVNNQYELLHSTCRGEVNNPQWEVKLYRNSPNETIGQSIDAIGMQDNWGRRAKRIFNQY